jgi:hypothetical protein
MDRSLSVGIGNDASEYEDETKKKEKTEKKKKTVHNIRLAHVYPW